MRAKKVTINGKEITLALDLNAITSFCDQYDIDFTQWESALNHPSKIRYFLYCMAISGESEVTEQEVGKMGLDEMTDILDGIGEKETSKKKSK